ncbi:DUF3341 domain-containing protein [Azospirillum sp. sgz301742]
MDHRHGVIVEFESADTLLDGLRRLRAAGFAHLEVYSPYPVDGVDELLGRRRGALPLVIFAAGMAGGLVGFVLQYYGLAVDYPLNIGGRPLNSWPAFSTTTFEMAALSMIVVGTLAFLWSCRLPRLYDPVFDVPGMERASQDRFLVRIAVRDGIGDRDRLEALFGARVVGEVP